MSDALCLATLQLFLALLRDEDIVDCLVSPATSSYVSSDGPVEASFAQLAALFEGLEPRRHADFADTLIDLTAAAPCSFQNAAAEPTSSSDSGIYAMRVPLSSTSLPLADRAMFATVLLNKVNGWLDAADPAVTLALSALLTTLARSRRAHVLLLVFGQREAAAADGGSAQSLLSILVNWWKIGRRREHRVAHLDQRLAACKMSLTQSADGTLRFLQAWLILQACVLELCATVYVNKSATLRDTSTSY